MHARHRLPTILALSLLTAAACDKGGGKPSTAPGDEAGEGTGFGYEDASSPDMAAIPHALDANDLEGVHARGMTLWKMQRALRLGDRAFAGFVGVTSAKFVSLASIDPGGKSGQVAYYQWDEAALADGNATADEAQNWVVVSVNVDPDESLEPIAREGKPEPEVTRTIAALMLAQAKAEADHAGGRWEAFTFREQVMSGGSPTGLRQTRIYMLGADDKSPDIEFTVHDPSKRKQPPQIVGTVVHLDGGATAKLPLTTAASVPGPSTVMRAVAIATVTQKPVELVDASGGKWSVAPKTGELSKR